MSLPSILHVMTSPAWGGLELYVLELVRRQRALGHKIALYCLPHSKAHQEALKYNIPVFEAYRHSRFSLQDIRKVRELMRTQEFCVLHTHTRFDVWLGSLAKQKAPHIYSLYMSAPPKKDPLHRFIYGRVDALTSSSLALNERVAKNYAIPPERIYWVPYGRDANLGTKNEEEATRLRSLWGTSSSQLVFGTASRLDAAKGVREVAEALLLLPPALQERVVLWVIGEPTLLSTDPQGAPVYEAQSIELYNWLKQFAASHPKLIRLIPFQRNLAPYLNALDVFVLGTYHETYSLSVLDAMGCGIPVIGTNRGGTPEQIGTNQRGLLIEPQQASAIAQAMAFYAQLPTVMSEHGLAAKRWAQATHHWPHTLALFNRLYQCYLDKKGSL